MRRLTLALALAALATAALAPAARADFGLSAFDVAFSNADGTPATQAGSHPFAMDTSLGVNFEHPGGLAWYPDGDLKDLIAEQLAGLSGDATAYPTCSDAAFLTNPEGAEVFESATECDESGTAVGVVGAWVPPLVSYSPVLNLTPPPGVAVRLGFDTLGEHVVIDVGVKPGGEYNVTAHQANLPQVLPILSADLQLWGNPADPAHDDVRGRCAVGQGSSFNPPNFVFESGGYAKPPCKTGNPERPFITLPTSCAGPAATSWSADSWQNPGALLPDGLPNLSDPAWQSGQALTHDDSQPPVPQGFSGCQKLPFSPSITARPTTRAAQSPSGLDFSLDVADEGLTSPHGLAQSAIEKAVVALPPGMSANPSLAEGLGVCTEADLGRETLASAPGQGCPEASKIGSVEVQTPLLGESLQGSLYVAKPYENEFHSLLALYMVIKSPNLGILVKQGLKVEPDPVTGQLVTVAEHIPQLPFSHLRLHLRQGARSPLISPPGCGTFKATAQLTPWSGTAPIETDSAFEIVSGPNEGPCPGAPAPFHPGFEAGSANNQAGAYSPFLMRLTRGDGEQDMTKFSAVLPPGVLGKLAGLTWCPQAGIDRARARTGPHGAEEELADPSCPASSKIGRTVAGAGVGSQLTYVPGSLYLAGPYHGDPLSVVSITPAQAGPFDAGVVVVREALTLNPVTAQVEVDGSASDPIPHILKGIPLNVRDLRVYADRPEFTLNPTDCEAEQTLATLWGGGTVLAPSGEMPVGLGARYQAANCAALPFKPKLAIKLKGGTKRGRFPALKALVTPRPGDADFKRAVVTLPHSAFLEQGHFGTICTRVQFAAGAGNGAGCPAASIYGHARAWTPLLSEPAEGPVYLRSSNHNLPDLVVALKGPPSAPFDVELDSRIDSHKGGIRSSFESIPDIPVSRFILEMQGGKKGLIVNSTNLCGGKHRAKADIAGQNGKVDRTQPLVQAQCPKRPKRKGSHRGPKKHRR